MLYSRSKFNRDLFLQDDLLLLWMHYYTAKGIRKIPAALGSIRIKKEEQKLLDEKKRALNTVPSFAK